MTPSLLYHASSPTLYPTNNPDESLLAIRFPSVVRISSVRIIPEGVRTFSGVGVTRPACWTGQLLFNISSSNPVNALCSTTISIPDSQHALDFPIDMPEGVTTRLMMLRSPATALTISIYGYASNDHQSHSVVEGQDVEMSGKEDGKHEDWTWLWTWAGADVGALLNLVEETTPLPIRQRALDCLDVLSSIDQPQITSAILDRPWLLSSLCADPSSSLVQRLLADPTFALHPLVKEYIPTTHPLYSLAHAASSQQHATAWRHLDLGLPALLCLQDCTEAELLRVEKGEETSNLVRLIHAAEGYAKRTTADSLSCLENALDILEPPPTDPIALSYLADNLPRLVAILNARTSPSGKRKGLSIPPSHTRQVLASLVKASTEVVNGKLVYPYAAQLAEPYLQPLAHDDPLRAAFTPVTVPSAIVYPDNADGRRLARLAKAISTSLPQPQTVSERSSLVHTATAAELLSLLAPALVKSLSTAAIPPFSITPNIAYASPDTQGASAWAGKVYSDHQFRTREAVGVGSTVPSGGIGGIGLGIAGMGASRPASKHVDEYAR